MKREIKFVVFFLIVLIVFVSCKKEKDVTPTPFIPPPIISPPISNKPPVARAGADILNELSCGNKGGYRQLDASGSFDPDGKIVSYRWAGISGTPGYVIDNDTLAKTWVHNFSAGDYAFELTVKDAGGLSSKDTVLFHVTGTPGPAKDYDLDITLNSTFSFYDNYFDDWDRAYYDYIYMQKEAIIPPLGVFNISVSEWGDTAALSDKIDGSYLYISAHYNYLSGVLSGINFKKLIRLGGGSFTGSCAIYDGSAIYCDANIFKNLTPLIVTGSLDLAAHTINLRIKGKVYF